jgi:hypothetical protein
MNEVKGDIWRLAHFLWDDTVIPTNPGWTKAGRNVMGRGIAAQALRRFPEADAWYGQVCMDSKGHPPVVQHRFNGIGGGRTLIFVPTKPFNATQPWMSWQAASSLEVIEQSLQELAMLEPSYRLPPAGIQPKIYVPLLGCGNGGLHREPVRELMDKYLTAPHFVRVRWEH